MAFFMSFVTDESGDIVTEGDKIMCKIERDGIHEVILVFRRDLVASGIIPADGQQAPQPGPSRPVIQHVFHMDETEQKYTKPHEWSTEETQFILDDHHAYISDVGPVKRFKNKKKAGGQKEIGFEAKEEKGDDDEPEMSTSVEVCAVRQGGRKRKSSSLIAEVLLQMHKELEDNDNERHQEQLALLQKLVDSINEAFGN